MIYIRKRPVRLHYRSRGIVDAPCWIWWCDTCPRIIPGRFQGGLRTATGPKDADSYEVIKSVALRHVESHRRSQLEKV